MYVIEEMLATFITIPKLLIYAIWHAVYRLRVPHMDRRGCTTLVRYYPPALHGVFKGGICASGMHLPGSSH